MGYEIPAVEFKIPAVTLNTENTHKSGELVT